MIQDTVYVKIEQSSEVKQKKVTINDVGKIYCANKSVEQQLAQDIFYVIKGNKHSKHMVSLLKVYEMIEKRYPGIHIVNLGERDFIVEYKPNQKVNKVWEYIKTIIVALVIFAGAAFTIMTFNTDVSVGDVFNDVYELIMGKPKTGGSILEIMYSIGLPIGIIVFYNHLSRKKIHNDPTPVQVEMRKYEEDVNKALIKNASREGKTIDAN